MRVGVLTSVHGPFDSRIFHKECRSLAAAGHVVTLIAPHERDETVAGVRVQAIRDVPEGKLRRMTTTTWTVYRQARRLNLDVYHLHDPELIPVGLLLRQHGKHVIYDAHEHLPDSIAGKCYIPRALRTPVAALCRALEGVAARRFSAVVAATPTIAEQFQGSAAETVVVRNYALLREWPAHDALPWRDRLDAVAYVGGITWNRGLREMVAAVNRVGATTRLTLAGPYSPPGLLREAASLRGWHRVDDCGVIDRYQVAALLRRVRAGLVVLHPTTAYVQSLPIKLFEYMASGLPFVGSDFPLWRDLMHGSDCGILVDPLDVGAIANALELLLTRPRDAEEMGRAGRALVERQYCWESEERALLELYARLGLGTRHSGRPSGHSCGGAEAGEDTADVRHRRRL